MSENSQPVKQEIARDEKGRFLPGVSGNPNGRPKFSLTSILREELQDVPEGQKVSRAISVIRKIVKQAEDGDIKSQKLIMNYIEGMPRQNIGLDGGEEGLPVLIKVLKDEEKRNKIKSQWC